MGSAVEYTVGGRTYRIGNLTGRKCVTWWEGTERKRFRFSPEINDANVVEALMKFIKGHTLAEEIASPAARVATCGILMADYIAERKADGKPVVKQEASWKALKPYFENVMPEHITKEMCKQFDKDRQAAGRKPATVWGDLGVLNAALGLAVKSKKLTKDARPHIWMPETPAIKDRWCTREEVDRLLAATLSPHMRLFVELAVGTAGRHQAILELEWTKVDFELRQIDLRSPRQTKNKRRALVPMTETLFVLLTEAKRAATTRYVIEYKGEKVGRVHKSFTRAAERAGLKGVTPHTLRHTSAVWMAAARIPMSQISQYLGHTSTTITERVYARYHPDHLRDAAAALETRPTVRMNGMGHNGGPPLRDAA